MERERRPNKIQEQCRLDEAFYAKIRASKLGYKLADKFVIPPHNGRGFIVNKGHTFRVIAAEGPQVADVTFWNAHNPKEYYAPAGTISREGFFIAPYTRLWSHEPWLRPMATCVEDTVPITDPEEGWHNHHVNGTGGCSAETWEMRSGQAGQNNDRMNFLQAIEPFGLTEENIRSNFNLHEKVRILANGRLAFGPSVSRKGDYIEFYAEIDLLVAVSPCPIGDNTRWQLLSRGIAEEMGTLRPLGVEIYDTGIQPKEFPKWTDWRPNWKGRWMPPEG